ncbi:hypothetical protein BsWGS_16261 [Bradybaena similaris]
MSCGSSCPCRFKWLVDTQGSKRDPINSEKAWLDFSVRLLSREVVGKAKGQETVWSERCKPHWWDREVELPWKNPTANPKDTKEVLLTKYTALERKLREEGRFPQELEEEAKLWNEGRYKELFLQTSLASLLGKVTGVHTAVIDALEKAKELKAQVNLALVNDLQQCLSSTLQVTNNLTISGCDNIKPTKRTRPGVNNSDAAFEKRRKVVREILPLDKQATPMPFQASQEVHLQPEFLANRKCLTRTNSAKRSKQKLHSAPSTFVPAKLTLVPKTTNCADPLQQPVSTSSLGTSQEVINHLILGNVIVCTNPAFSVTPDLTAATTLVPPKQVTNSPKLSVHSNPSQYLPELVEFNQKLGSTPETFLFSSDMSNSHNLHAPSENTHNSNVNFFLSPVENNSNNNSIIPDIIQNSHSSNNSVHSMLFDDNDIATSSTSSPVNLPSQSSSDRVTNRGITSNSETDHNISDTDYSTEQSMLEYSTEHSMLEYSTGHSMQEYSTEHQMLNLDDIYSRDEQEQLWKEDGSYLLERFLEDLDGSVDSDIPNTYN